MHALTRFTKKVIQNAAHFKQSNAILIFCLHRYTFGATEHWQCDLAVQSLTLRAKDMYVSLSSRSRFISHRLLPHESYSWLLGRAVK